MSLKAFHVFFIGVSTLMLLAVAAWCVSSFREAGSPGYLSGAVLCVAASVTLVVYGRYFLRKFRHISYL